MLLDWPVGTLVSPILASLSRIQNTELQISLGRKPTSASSESKVSLAEGTMPWQVDSSKSEDFKYQYHPGGDKSKAPKEAPSALNTVIVPNVNLPKSLHERFNKYGKD